MQTTFDSGQSDVDVAIPPIEKPTRSPEPQKPVVATKTPPQLRRWAALGGLGIGLLVVLWTAVSVIWGPGTGNSELVFHTVKSGNLSITVTERGNLESQQNVKLFCEVDDISGDNIDGTAILSIVENGAEVKQGDLLVELDSAGHLERVDAQVLDTEKASAVKIQAEIKYKNQVSQNQTLEDQAALAVRLAGLQLEMFTHEENGTSVLEADEINREIDDTENQILAAKASLKLIENEKQGTEELFKLGYAGRSEVDKIRLDYLQAQSLLAAQINKLETQLGTLSKKTDFERRMSVMQFEGDEQTAIRELAQVKRNNEAELAKAKVALDAAERQLTKEQERLDRYKGQLEKCKVYAPQDGMVAYATPSRYSRSSAIAEGALIRERQHILSLPNLRSMQVKTSVHESVQNQIAEGLEATVRLDAFPDRQYQGRVKSVGVLPENGSWYNSDTKMYETYVTIEEEVDDIKPGMTAVVEILVDQLTDVLTVPVQAIQQEDSKTFCYVQRGGRIIQQDIEVGRTNDKFVEIKTGIQENDRVVLNPLAVTEG